MKPLLIHYYYGVMDGVFASIIDLYYNLSMYIDIELQIVSNIPVDCINHLNRNNNKDLISKVRSLKDIEVVENDVIICSARFIYDSVCKIHCNKLIILDSLDLAKSKYAVQPKLEEFIPTDIDSVTVLCNPSNIMLDRPYFQVVYFQKLSKRRLDLLPIYYGKHPDDYTLKKDFFYENYHFRRTNKQYGELLRGKYFENFGRRVFEHIYFRYNVIYYPDGMFVKDGMYYYLGLFKVDGLVPHSPLPIDKQMIEEELFMNDDDIILGLI